ncbi:putative oxalate decarboxylase/oxidase [Calocera viscosa TUFC12733]|uniref:Putative oxalate decarboxylase/oxidase n=1 Tax=Calocera viscosa (strain TUFC12733) TaxID=1330018 RepID=A0A167N3G3_CALVF|nr:putative oxalate decarboxylase/oxidase [Calocera viscosa TUFC12733]
MHRLLLFAALPLALASPLDVRQASTTSTAAAATPTVPYASDDPNDSFYEQFNEPGAIPEPQRGSTGGNILGPDNRPLDMQNPDTLAPPSTDAGDIANSKWPFTLSHNRLQTGGWARQQNVHDMPIATALAGVNMRLEAGAYRELHWHTAAEWSYVIAGSCRISSVDQLGRNYLADVYPGDLWYFPAGIPHSLQGLNDTADGCEFLLVFDNGEFSEDDTFLLTDWLAHVPKEVIAKNFQLDISLFDHIPGRELYIFPGNVPPPLAQDTVSDPNGQVPEPFSFPFSQVTVTPLQGGSVKIADSRTFQIATTIIVAEVIVDPGAMRELHWHPTMPEWSYFLEGEARLTSFAASATARTFNYQAGDIAYIPPAYGHYIENIGNTTVKYLEIFNTDIYQDISLTQWLALTPPEVVQAHLQLPLDVIQSFNKSKVTVI